MDNDIRARVEALGPADRMIQATLTHVDHLVHNRPGIVTPAPGTPTGVKWEAATRKQEDGQMVAYFLRKVGKKSERVRAGVITDWNDATGGTVREGGRVVGNYRQPGLGSEVLTWTWRQIAEVYKMDNDLVAHWASYAFSQDHRDMKVALAAFLLVQPRVGEPLVEDGKALRDDQGRIICDADYREVGESMMLIRLKDKDLNPRLLLRIGDILAHPEVAQINRELGFGRSARNPTLGRWPKAVASFLRHLERTPPRMAALVGRAGFRTSLIALAQRIGYKPESPKFFQDLRWKQVQTPDGRRVIAVGADVVTAETWEGLSEGEICQRIVAQKPAYKRIVGMLPKGQQVTRAIMAAAVEAGCLSDADLRIYTGLLEDLGLTTVEPVKSRWEAALRKSPDLRVVNIAGRVKNQATKDKLEAAADAAMAKAVTEDVRGLTIYFMVDVSSSMTTAIATAKTYATQLLRGFPLNHLRVCVFNTSARPVEIKIASAVGVEAAFRGIDAGGGTDYGAGVMHFRGVPPVPDTDALLVFVGDNDPDNPRRSFAGHVRASGLNPAAIALVHVTHRDGHVCDVTAAELGIPCFRIDTQIFDDVYALPRTFRNLIKATPVDQVARVGRPAPAAVAPRVSLVEQILRTPLLEKPAWA